WKLRTLAAIVASFVVVTAVSAGAPRYAEKTKGSLREGAASGPREIGGPRKVGEDRVRHVILPGPVRAADGSGYVPTELKALPVEEIDYHVQDDPSEDIHGAPMGARGASPDRSMVVSPNVRANNTALDPAGSCQSETAITASGMNLVAAWNDGTNFSV